ncbi:pyruvate dehydrogenase E2 component (dihydrolipoamide acetyltransferase) [Scopulibacillus darangshiensis]|uniref:Dihydrolipoamide acetyltransferase component of pyruvate dehydrogenase complex n=1 Tax=Scopulibacillus darangshiensis TaxID=442528 RepID=A0A4R2P3P1_9BACL|nr:dihydrolipoamide acetyltransferase family protein [Scopulibacillus darangshiensis]TCP29237.1 pyruvate dehydrogenase E2 component (dihydrolipoamide acetyltransferase) [Scopulibacillus darangshiensis]
MVDVKLHDIGEGMTEGEVIHLFVKIGDHVAIDQPLVEVQTDKMTAELPSPAAGTVQDILVGQGDVIEVGATMVIIDNGKSETIKNVKREASIQKVSSSTNDSMAENVAISRSNGPRRILAAPHTRKLARTMQVNIENIEGTGRLGRITDEDVERHASGISVLSESAASTASVEEPVTHSDESGYDDIPFIGRRRAIAKKMAQSLYTIPHVTHFDEADVTDLLKLKATLKELDADFTKGYNVSLAAFFIKAIAIALKDFPIFNARLDEERQVVRMEKAVHMGLATDTEEGLIVPVIKHVERKSLLAIHKEMKDLIKKAQQNQLKRDEMTGSTFTISNVGPLGSTGATPIINYPEVGLMAFHKTKKMPVVNDKDDIVIRSMMNLSMSFDHRVADGGKAVAFTNRIIELLQHPEIMMLDLK